MKARSTTSVTADHAPQVPLRQFGVDTLARGFAQEHVPDLDDSSGSTDRPRPPAELQGGSSLRDTVCEIALRVTTGAEATKAST